MLLKAGSDPNCINKDGQKPIDAAKVNKETLLVELLEFWDQQSSSSSSSTSAEGKLNGHAQNADSPKGHTAESNAAEPVLAKPS